MSETDFQDALLNGLKDEPFKPVAYYDSDGDCLEFIASPEPFIAKRCDDLLTVYYGEQSRKIVGSQIKAVSSLFKHNEGM